MPDLRKMIFLALRLIGLVSCASFMGVPAFADSLPASVRACIGEADPARRLTCYDREVARVIAPPDTFASTPAAPPALVPPVTSRPMPAAAPAVPAAAVAATTSPPMPAAAAATTEPRHYTAKVTAVRQSGDYLIVTLDNGNVWEQSVPGTSPLHLRAGEAVLLDRSVGSWFLSNQYGDSIQVRLRQP